MARAVADSSAAAKFFGLSIGLLVFLTASPVLAQDQGQSQVLTSTALFRKEYVLAAGDQIEVFVRRVPEVSRTVTIRPDGFVSLPIVDSIRAAGFTPSELRLKLIAVLGYRLVEPEVNVIPIQTRQPTVYVSGEVNSPGAMPLRSAPTAMQAISAAGGFRRTGSPRHVWIIRVGEDQRVNAIPVFSAIKGQQGPYLSLAAVPLQPDDVIFVPENKRSEFTRFLDDFLNRPLQGFNSLVGTYLNFKLIQIYSRIP